MTDTATSLVLKRLIDERDQLAAEIDCLQNKIAGLEIAINLITGQEERGSSPVFGKVHVTETIVGLLGEAGPSGLEARAVIERAAGRGINLNRGSVYSLLNRLERAGTVVHEGHRYKLCESGQRSTNFLPESSPALNRH